MKAIAAMKRLTLFVFVLILAGCSASPLQKPGAAQSRVTDTAPTASVDLEVRPIPGYRAAVLLNFWATWCGPCRLEMPAMEILHQESKGRVRVLAVGADGHESPAALAAFARDLNLTFNIGHDTGSAAEAYKVLGLPTTLLIDQQGVIRVGHTGPLTLEQMRSYLIETLGEAFMTTMEDSTK